jgi:hypothetical protein
MTDGLDERKARATWSPIVSGVAAPCQISLCIFIQSAGFVDIRLSPAHSPSRRADTITVLKEPYMISKGSSASLPNQATIRYRRDKRSAKSFDDRIITIPHPSDVFRLSEVFRSTFPLASIGGG